MALGVRFETVIAMYGSRRGVAVVLVLRGRTASVCADVMF